MAQKIHIVLEDDLDGSEATETVSFGLDGTSYEIDLNEENASALRGALATYVGHARKVSGTRRGAGGRRSGGSASANASGGPTAKEIRDWARQNGFEVPDRGRVSAEVREAYDSAH
ncbi:histone-like nucleoid-structuring protein Lsr2 [Nocardioides marmotae]|uniref:Lsr2 family protein n=1 Tax=Nocardioides marmotae TaxID=2663857 RepID=A0A6I3IX05_9ACTN|nr:Lsr2 family protein [Nocardioides marmotae]MCR6029977.1 Lsr2 family protein [Gordonia jinghuaiqii]MBC9732933.1 Lsr2 family protein [Nocardioides marmotae]MTB84047.1 Lsr2 family protein [Nocardioides marmotae]MTB93607.1 Lsr2 family protein [Nocardioides marmotae]QKD99969.1 Lsr2 family protein [Nocardioides marmotae]